MKYLICSGHSGKTQSVCVGNGVDGKGVLKKMSGGTTSVR